MATVQADKSKRVYDVRPSFGGLVFGCQTCRATWWYSDGTVPQEQRRWHDMLEHACL